MSLLKFDTFSTKTRLRVIYLLWKIKSFLKQILVYQSALRKLQILTAGDFPRVRKNTLEVAHLSKLDSMFRYRQSELHQEYVFLKKVQAAGEQLFSEINLLILLKQRISGSDTMIENEFAYNLSKSLEEINIHAEVYWPLPVFESNHYVFKNSIELLEEKIRTICPSHLILDSNQFTRDPLLNEQALFQLKQKYRFKVIIFMLDYHGAKLEYWGHRLADTLVYCRPDKRSKVESVSKAKLICWPGSPYPEYSKFTIESSIDFFYSGSDTRNRRDFLSILEKVEMNAKINFGNRERTKSYTYLDYLDELGNAKMTFSNGYISRREDLITGRALEAFSTKTLLLYEESKTMNYFFKPYIHFVPVKTSNDLLTQVLYLLRNEDMRLNIASQAHDFYRSQYSNLEFWLQALN